MTATDTLRLDLRPNIANDTIRLVVPPTKAWKPISGR